MLNASDFPPAIDEHAEQYLQLKANCGVADAALDEKKEQLVKLAQKSGSMAEGAKKSMRLTGDRYQITASFGTSTAIDKLAVGKLQYALVEQGTPGLFKKLFHSDASYVVLPTAQAIVETLAKPLRDLFARCTVTKPREPSLKVEKKAKK